MKLVGYLLSTLILVGIVACSSDTDGGDDGTTVAATVNSENAQNVPTSAPNPVPEQPEYIRKAEELPKTQISFATEKYDFKKVPEGEKVYYKYKFTNAGAEDLLITYVKPSCGCTTPEWSRSAIAPGAEGFIDVEFDSRGKSGAQKKSIVVFGNFEGQTSRTLRLEGVVVSE